MITAISKWPPKFPINPENEMFLIFPYLVMQYMNLLFFDSINFALKISNWRCLQNGCQKGMLSLSYAVHEMFVS